MYTLGEFSVSAGCVKNSIDDRDNSHGQCNIAKSGITVIASIFQPRP